MNQQCQAVLRNKQKLVDTLRSTADAEESLLTAFQIKNWLGGIVKAEAMPLITQAINQIKLEEKNYEVFIGMLQDIPGMNVVIKLITDMCPLSSTGGPKDNITLLEGNYYQSIGFLKLLDLIDLIYLDRLCWPSKAKAG
ncbi:hypothetical protein GBAR_LOCUS30811 [Geodia barretti]|uniref:Uncharacterized protein n=1 Tax=Geodia barretti TaxID=519541 RepID=A0AA35TZ03_GEOBA|nr:hypothetical protein GBAR_LOCUS30811 [Geodia barretti]